MVGVTPMSRRDSHACHGDTRGRDTPSPPKGGVGGVTTSPAWVAGPAEVEIGNDLVDALRRIVSAHDAGEPIDVSVAISAAYGLSAAAATFDVNCFRRTTLRCIWNDHYPGKTRTAAARLIAASWGQWKKEAPVPPGSQAEYFKEMDQRGISPKCARTVYNDLDFSLDGGPRH